MSDSCLFAVSLSKRGDSVYFSVKTGRVSLAPFEGWEALATAGIVRNRSEIELEQIAQNETLALECAAVLDAFSHEPAYHGVYA